MVIIQICSVPALSVLPVQFSSSFPACPLVIPGLPSRHSRLDRESPNSQIYKKLWKIPQFIIEGRSLHSLRSVEMTGKGSLVIPDQPPSVIPGLTGNLSRWQSGQLTVRHQNGEKHDGRSRFGMFHRRFRHRPT